MVNISVDGFVLLAYLSLALRGYIASKWDDFKPRSSQLKLDLSAMDAKEIKSLKAMANFALLILTFFWPLFLLCYPKNFLQAFVLSQKAAINRMNIIVGITVGKTLALFREFFNQFN